MASSKKAAQVVMLMCPDCKNRIPTKKNVKVHKERLELNKFCPKCRMHKKMKEQK